MGDWRIEGGHLLNGSVKISGSKNAALPILAGAILSKDIVHLHNIPKLRDTCAMIKIMEILGAKIYCNNYGEIIVDSRCVKYKRLDDEIVSSLRASYYFMGVMLALFKKSEIIAPGGCKFSKRPIDQHLLAFSSLGYTCIDDDGLYKFKKTGKRQSYIKFEKVSVGATINAILASIRINGKIELINVAKEPEIDNFIEFLNSMGARITRMDNKIIVVGVKKLHGTDYRVMDDRIEAGTFLVLGALCANRLEIIYDSPRYLDRFIDTLNKLNVKVKVYDHTMVVYKCNRLNDERLIFEEYPGLPTDLQQPMSILLSRCNHLCVLKDSIYPSRYTQIEDLLKMGFTMKVYKNQLYVNDSLSIKGARVICRDLRGGISLVLAALVANGVSTIENTEYIERGYENLILKLKKIGAIIDEEN